MDVTSQINIWIGRSIGDRQRYRITSRLGGGGMGEVFLAIDTLLGQQVALKLLKEKLLGEGDLRQRFEREALLCAAIHSDNVIQVKDFGFTDDGYPFYVMEYLRGQTLGQLLHNEKRLPIERAANIVSQVCEGLHMAHTGVEMWHEDTRTSESIKVVHRDLKPENIFLIDTTIGELVKILDFGIAKAFSKDVTSTHTGMFMGTFQYSSPEQLEASKNLDERADIYSLGMILYEMLSGTDPFGCSAGGYDRAAMRWVRAHTSEPPQHLRAQLGCEQISLKLEAVVMQCLRKSPSGRFASVEALNQALHDAVDFRAEVRTSARSMRPTAQLQISHDSPSSKEAETVTAHIAPLVTNQELPQSQLLSQPAALLTEPLREQLESILMSYIGPIAPILFQQVVSQASDPQDLIDRLAQHLPPTKQVEFKSRAKSLLGTSDAETKASLVPPVSQLLPRSGSQPSQPTPRSTIFTAANISDAPLTQGFIEQCERELAESIGPMAKFILQRALEQNPTQFQLIDLLMPQIPTNQRTQFRQRIEKWK